MSKKNNVIKQISTSKQFSYNLEDVNLNFGLNVDNSSQLSKFKRLLEAALKDITELLEQTN